jgi:hypothetical protein
MARQPHKLGKFPMKLGNIMSKLFSLNMSVVQNGYIAYLLALDKENVRMQWVEMLS